MNPPTTIILHMTDGETITFIGSEVTMVDQVDETGVFARSIIIKGVQSTVNVEHKRKKFRRKIERRAPKVGVNIRYEDKDKEPGFEPKRVRRGKLKTWN